MNKLFLVITLFLSVSTITHAANRDESISARLISNNKQAQLLIYGSEAYVIYNLLNVEAEESTSGDTAISTKKSNGITCFRDAKSNEAVIYTCGISISESGIRTAK